MTSTQSKVVNLWDPGGFSILQFSFRVEENRGCNLLCCCYRLRPQTTHPDTWLTKYTVKAVRSKNNKMVFFSQSHFLLYDNQYVSHKYGGTRMFTLNNDVWNCLNKQWMDAWGWNGCREEDRWSFSRWLINQQFCFHVRRIPQCSSSGRMK